MAIQSKSLKQAQSGLLRSFSTDSPSGANLIPAGVVATTWNPSDKGANLTLSGSNVIVTASSAGWNSVRSIYSTDGVSKYYWEVKMDSTGGASQQVLVGVSTGVPATSTFQSSGAGYEYYYTGDYYHTGTNNAYGSAWGVGDVISMAFDSATNKMWWAKNGVWQNSGDPAAGTGAITLTAATYYACLSAGYTFVSQTTANFGASPFAYTVPSGFKAGFGS